MELLRFAVWADGRAAGLGAGQVDDVVELMGIGHLDPALLGDDEDAGSAVGAETVGESEVGLNFVLACAAGVHHKGHSQAAGLEPAAGEVGEIVFAADVGLAGEEVATEGLGEQG